MVTVTTGISSDFDIEVDGPVEPGTQLVCGPFKVLNKELEAGVLLDVKDESSMTAGKDE